MNIWSVNIKKVWWNERGSALVLVALVMVALLGCVGLVTDIGTIYFHRLNLENAADAAALAGAQELPDDPEKAVAVAEEYAARNGVRAQDLQVEVAGDSRSLTITTRRRIDFLFARVLGFSSREVAATATARVGALSGAIGVTPFSIKDQQLVYGKEYVLKYGSGSSWENGGRIYGWFGALDLGGSGACQYRHNIEYGYYGLIRVGDVLPVETGNMSGPTIQGVEWRLEQCTDGCTFDNFTRDCPKIMLVPVVRYLGGHGSNQSVEVRGFAAFFLEGVEGQGNVIGRFVRTVAPGEIGDGSYYGLVAVKLTRQG